MGTVITFFFCAVVILEVEESPGRSPSGGFCSVTTTLKSFASWLPVVDCVEARPELRSTACVPTSVTFPLKNFPGMASMVTSASSHFHAHDVGFIHHHFGGHHGHIRNGHQVAAGGVLDSGNH